MNWCCLALVIGLWPAATRAQVQSPEPVLLGECEFQIRREQIEPVKPEYPEAARRAGIQGEVLMFVWYDKDGKLIDAEPLRSSHKLLTDVAVGALKESRIKPHESIFPNASYIGEITFIFLIRDGEASVAEPPPDVLIQVKVSQEFNDFRRYNKEFQQEKERRAQQEREQSVPRS